MIGHYVNNLDDDQADGALTEVMAPGGVFAGCLLARTGFDPFRVPAARRLACWPRDGHAPVQYVGAIYDALCRRFGAPRVNAAIRNRILSNRARRVLVGSPTVTQGATK